MPRQFFPKLTLSLGYPKLEEENGRYHPAYMPPQPPSRDLESEFASEKIARVIYGANVRLIKDTGQNSGRCSDAFIAQVSVLIDKMRPLDELRPLFDGSHYALSGRASFETSYLGQYLHSLRDPANGLYPGAPADQLLLIKEMLERLCFFYHVLKIKIPAKAMDIAQQITHVPVCGPGSFEKLLEIDKSIMGVQPRLNDWLAELRENLLMVTAAEMMSRKRRSLQANFRRKYPMETPEEINTRVDRAEIHMQTALRVKARDEYGLNISTKGEFNDPHIRSLELNEEDYSNAFRHFQQLYAENAVEFVVNELRRLFVDAFNKRKNSRDDVTIAYEQLSVFKDLLESSVSDFEIPAFYFINDDNGAATLELSNDVLTSIVLTTFISRGILDESAYIALGNNRYFLSYHGKVFLFDKNKSFDISNVELEGWTLKEMVSRVTKAEFDELASSHFEWAQTCCASLPSLDKITEEQIIACETNTLMCLYDFCESNRFLIQKQLVERVSSDPTNTAITVFLFKNRHYIDSLQYPAFGAVPESEQEKHLLALYRVCNTTADIHYLTLMHRGFTSYLAKRDFLILLEDKIELLQLSDQLDIINFLQTNARAQLVLVETQLNKILTKAYEAATMQKVLTHARLIDAFFSLDEEKQRKFLKEYFTPYLEHNQSALLELDTQILLVFQESVVMLEPGKKTQVYNKLLEDFRKSGDDDQLKISTLFLKDSSYRAFYIPKVLARVQKEKLDQHVLQLFQRCESKDEIECLYSKHPKLIALLEQPDNNHFIKDKISWLVQFESGEIQRFLSENASAAFYAMQYRFNVFLNNEPTDLDELNDFQRHPQFISYFNQLPELQQKRFFAKSRGFLVANSSKDCFHQLLLTSIRKVSSSDALAIISNHIALIKNIVFENPAEEPPFSDPKNGWGFLVRQLKDPVNCRPAKKVPDGADRTRYFNPETCEWLIRSVNPEKGQPKPGATFTKKTATSLLPPNGQMQLFFRNSNEQRIGILFDLTKCNIKQYVFEHNVRSDDRFWLYGARNGTSKPGGTPLPLSVTLDDIRKQHHIAIQKKEIPKWNEILPGLAADAVIGVAVSKDNLVSRLNAQYRRLILRRELYIDVPILMVMTDKPVHDYTQAMQLQDLAQASKSAVNSAEYDFFKAIISMAPELDVRLIDIHQAIKDRDIDKINLVVSNFPEYMTKIQNDTTPIELAATLDHWDSVIAIAKVVKTDAQDLAKYGSVLLTAALKKQTTAALVLIEAGAPVNQKNPNEQDPDYGYFAIHYAIEHNDLVLLEAILKKHSALAAKSQHKNCITPLSLALSKNNVQIIILFIEHGVTLTDNFDAFIEAAQNKNWNGVSACFNSSKIKDDEKSKLAGHLLHEAVTQKDLETVKRLLTQNPLMNVEKDQITPIQLAAQLCLWDCVEAIATAVKADIADTACYGDALIEAARANEKKAALALVNNGASFRWRYLYGVNEGYFAIHFAIRHNNVPILKAIVEKGGETAVNRCEKNKMTPLQLALKYNQPQSIQLLLKHGAEQLEVDLVVQAAGTENWDGVFAYLDNIHTPKQLAGKLLHVAIAQKELGIVERLLSKNASVDIEINQKTPILLAAELDLWDCVEKIAKVVKTNYLDIKKKYGFVLLTAALKKQTAAALALIEAGVPLDKMNMNKQNADYGYFAIHYAIEHNDLVLLEAILKKHSAAANSQHEDCITPLSLALSKNNIHAIDLLKRHGEMLKNYFTDFIKAAKDKKWEAVFACVMPEDAYNFFDARYNHFISRTEKSKLAGHLLHEAVRQKDLKTVQRLLTKDPLLSVKIDKNTPIQLAAQLCLWDCVEAIATAVKADIGDTARYGSALIEAARANETKAALALVNSIEYYSLSRFWIWRYPSGEYEGYFAIHFAILHENVDLLKAILEKGRQLAANSQMDNKMTPLQLATKYNKQESIKLLLDYGAVRTAAISCEVEAERSASSCAR